MIPPFLLKPAVQIGLAVAGVVIAGAIITYLSLRLDNEKLKAANALHDLSLAIQANESQTEALRHRSRLDELKRQAAADATQRRDAKERELQSIIQEFQNAQDAGAPAGPAFDRAAERLRSLDAARNHAN